MHRLVKTGTAVLAISCLATNAMAAGTVCAKPQDAQALQTAAVQQRLMVADPLAHEHLVELRKPFWGDALRTEGRTDTVPPALVYADLLATGDGRCIETAQMVYKGYLARLFPAA